MISLKGNFKLTNVLLLGAEGFIGQALAQALSHVSTLALFCSDKSHLDLTDCNAQSELIDLISINSIQVVVVLSAIKRHEGDSQQIKKLNDCISNNITSALERISKSVHIVFLSSLAVFGEKNNQINFTEDSPVCPTSFYGEHKVYSESLYQALAFIHNVAILRPPMVYSQNLLAGYHPVGFYYLALARKEIILWGDGSEYREFLYVWDLVYIIVKIINLKVSGVYNVVSGMSCQYSEIVEYISTLIDFVLIKKQRSYPKVDHFYDSTKLKSFLGPSSRFICPYNAIKLSHYHHLFKSNA